MKYIFFLSTSILLLAVPVSFGKERADTTAAVATKQLAAKTKPTLMFFMNPNGRPCQMQHSILDNIKKELDSICTVTYVKTTVSSDRELFYKHGIRGLPNLIITDKNGKELKRFTPGIQSGETIITTLKSIN